MINLSLMKDIPLFPQRKLFLAMKKKVNL